MAGSPDARGQRPWPTNDKFSESSPEKNLDRYVPQQWRCKTDWHAYRSRIAGSLGRSALPEVRAMGEQENMRPGPGNDPSQINEDWQEVENEVASFQPNRKMRRAMARKGIRQNE